MRLVLPRWQEVLLGEELDGVDVLQRLLPNQGRQQRPTPTFTPQEITGDVSIIHEKHSRLYVSDFDLLMSPPASCRYVLPTIHRFLTARYIR